MKKRTTLAKQLTVKIVIIAALIFIVAMFFAITVAKNTASKLSKDVMKKETTTAQNEIEDWVSGKTGYLDGLLDAVKNLDNPSDEVLFGLLSGAVAQESLGASDVYMAGAEHWFCDGTGWIPGEDFDATTRGWYISGLANEKMHIGEVYLDAITGTYMVGVSAKVSDKTVLSADISIDEVARETNSITILDSGYAMLIEKNTGFVIAHPDDKIAGTTIAENGDVFLSDIYANINNMDTLFPITYDGQKYFVIMEEIKGTDWILIGCAPYSCVMGQLSNLQVMITFMVVIALLILIMVSVLLIRQATKPIHELTESIEVITSGDFTKEVRTSGNNEITTTEEALKKFIARMRDVIRDVSDVSNKLADDADNSKKASQNIYDSVENQTCSVKQLNEAVDEVGRSIEDLATNATSLAMVVSEVNEDGTKASADMQNAYELAEEGRRDIQKVADKMEEILSAITNLKQTVSEVGKSTKEINQITDVIGDISSQTNLLALNASIEAARAGEAGKGFAVVATEIGNLANMSASAVTKIADMINQMDLDMKQCIEQTDITEKDIDESGNYVKKTYETFGQIYDKIEVTTGLIEKMTKKIQTVDEVAANMAATTEEQSAKTQEMMDTAQELYQHSVTIENNSADIRTLSEEVSGFADKVKERLDVFEI